MEIRLHSYEIPMWIKFIINIGAQEKTACIIIQSNQIIIILLLLAQMLHHSVGKKNYMRIKTSTWWIVGRWNGLGDVYVKRTASGQRVIFTLLTWKNTLKSQWYMYSYKPTENMQYLLCIACVWMTGFPGVKL